jgi:hypothetical protein
MLMRPYSLGHELHLLREDNPLVSGGINANPRREDLAQAVLVCSQTFEECRRMNSDWLLPLKGWLWRRRVRKLPTGPHVQAFLEYRQDGMREFPPSSTPRSDSSPGRPAGAPFLLRLYQFLVVEMHMPTVYQHPLTNEVLTPWDHPFGLAQMQFATHWEERGSFDIYNYHDAVHDEAARKLDEWEAKNGQWKPENAN